MAASKKPRSGKGSSKASKPKSPRKLLKETFVRNGYIRTPDKQQKKNLGLEYKKGYEVRLVASTQRELREIRRALTTLGLKPGKPFKKHKQSVQPVYGQDAVQWFSDQAPERLKVLAKRKRARVKAAARNTRRSGRSKARR